MKTAWMLTFLLAVPLQAQIRRIEISPTSDGTEVLCALIPAPERMNARELGAWQLICSGFLEGNDIFVKEDILRYGGQAGFTPKVQWSNEGLSLQFVSLPGGEPTMSRLLESVITQPKLDDDRLAELRVRLGAPFPDDWSAMLMGERGDTVIPGEFVRRFSARALRPDSLILSGTPGAIKSTSGRFSDWNPPRVSPDVRVTNSSRFRGPESAKGEVLVGATFLPTTNEAAKVLALVALGGGKSALLHQVLREKEGWTYRQEAILRPERSGLRPVLALQSSKVIPGRQALVSALEKAVEALEANDLHRFKVLTESAISGTNPLSPFRFGGIYTGSPQDRAVWMAYALLWDTPSSTPEAILADTKRVTLDELKDALKQILAQLMPE